MQQVIYGYARVSTIHQKIERQRDNIKAQYPDAIMFEEAFTGTKISRPVFDKMIDRAEKQVAKGADVTIVFDEVSRMSRNAKEGFELYQKLFNEGISLVFIKEPHINTQVFKDATEKGDAIEMTGTDIDYILKGINQYLMIVAQKQFELAFQSAQREVDYLHQRTREGVEKARQAGKQIGREAGSTFTTKKGEAAKAILLKHCKDFGGTLNDIDTLKLAGCSRNSYYKYKAELRAQVKTQNGIS